MAGYRRLPSGKWQASVRLPDGRRVTRSDPLKSVVRAWAADQESQVRRGDWRDPRLGRTTVGGWLDTWVAARVVERETARADVAPLARIRDAFGARPVGSVTRIEVQGWVRRLQDQEVGPAAVCRAYYRLHSLFAAAVDEGIVAASPCRKITLPATPPQLPRWYTSAEVQRLVAELPEPHATMTLVMCWVGLRWGECAGLRVEDVDWLRRRVRVVGTLGQGGGWKAYPKSRKSRREVPVPVWLIKRMSTLLAGADRRYVFVTRRGGRPLQGANWRRVWYAAVERSGVSREVPHVCRHTAASWLVQAGVDLYRVQALLGHESFRTTQQYSHLAPDAHGAIEGAWERMAHMRRTDIEDRRETGR